MCDETGRRHDARLWLRGFAGLPVRVPCFEKPRDGAGVPLRAPCECVESRRRSNRCTSGGAREPRMTSRRRRARSTARSARTPAREPTAASSASPPPRRGRRRRAGRSCRISAGLHRGVDAAASRCFGRPASTLRRSRRWFTTLGRAVITAFRSGFWSPQVSSLAHSRKGVLCGAIRARKGSRRRPLRELTGMQR